MLRILATISTVPATGVRGRDGELVPPPTFSRALADAVCVLPGDESARTIGHSIDDANPLTTTFADYLMPTAEVVPNSDIVHMESPTPLNPLGAKGAGEGGTIPAPAAIVAAVESALSPYGLRITDCPITPQRIIELIQAATEPKEDQDQ